MVARLFGFGKRRKAHNVTLNKLKQPLRLFMLLMTLLSVSACASLLTKSEQSVSCNALDVVFMKHDPAPSIRADGYDALVLSECYAMEI